MGFEFLLGAGALFGVGAFVILFLAGFLSAVGPGGSATLTVVTPPGPGANCTALCAFWNSARATACASTAAAAAAAAALAAANAAVTSATLTAVVLLAAAIAASWIPFIGPAIAAPLFAAYLVAQAVVVFLLGRVAAAALAASGAAGTVRTDLAAVTRARAAVVSGCTDPALTACLATPSPCAGVP